MTDWVQDLADQVAEGRLHRRRSPTYFLAWADAAVAPIFRRAKPPKAVSHLSPDQGHR